ncbi:MAG TPA: GNAT family N-acetyltransferase [Streptosporangiaceae bacterium]|nr:GNAT family N-acetyltransferase [Streptosporangiaceae bacterium]
MPELIAPTTRLRESWLAARNEWGLDADQAGSGLHPDDDVDSPEGFARWVARLHCEADRCIPPAAGRVHATYWWIADSDSYLGAITLRHALNDVLLRAGGHIGYGVRPSARRRGIATWALRSVLPEARSLGLQRVLVTCGDANLASARTIEKAGGVLEDVRDTGLGRTRRYWITLG